MNRESTSKRTKVCPTCGTRLSEDATRCLVCGTELSVADTGPRPSPAVRGSRMPEVTLSLPAVLAMLVVFIAIGGGLVYFALRQPGQAAALPDTPTPTVTLTPTATITPTPVTPTVTNTPQPTPTPQTYRVKLGDTCSSIAFSFGVSIQSIVLLNDLPASCDTLFEGQPLQIPYPTPTVTPQPSATLSAAEATEAACEKIDYTVQDNDSLSRISADYRVPIAVLKEYNGLVNDVVRSGQRLVIPLCERQLSNVTPTPTIPPPYPAPNLLLPADGAPFTSVDFPISLQWAAVGTLRENEAYAVNLVIVTGGQEQRLVEYVTGTNYLVPASFLPTVDTPHVIRWTVVTVRQTGTDNDGNPIWEPAGAVSDPRVFTWTGAAAGIIEATPTP